MSGVFTSIRQDYEAIKKGKVRLWWTMAAKAAWTR